jgi:nicotinamide-nucleotide amidase
MILQSLMLIKGIPCLPQGRHVPNKSKLSHMKTEIINIGNELLIGQVVNTNAAWMAEQLNLAGFWVDRITVVPDEWEEIFSILNEAKERSSVVLVTGGLGPTKDDITKEVLCRVFNTKLVFHEEAFKDIETLFRARGFKVSDLNRKQAELPENCIAIPNPNGTARGMWFTTNDNNKRTDFIFMPGVPYEMKTMLSDRVIPELKKIYSQAAIYHKTVLTQGIGESFLSEIIEEWEKNLPENISLAYLPQPGIVRLRLTGKGDDETNVKNQVEAEVNSLLKIIPEYFYGFDNEKLEVITGELLRKKSVTLATAESCTGGYIAHLITSVPGSSKYYKGSIIAYSNDIKENELEVERESLIEFGAVSEEVVKEMATGIHKKFDVDYAIATSGIAGPDGGTPGKPVGTTWIAIATPVKTVAYHYLFGEDRERNIRKTALQALNLLRKEIGDTD